MLRTRLWGLQIAPRLFLTVTDSLYSLVIETNPLDTLRFSYYHRSKQAFSLSGRRYFTMSTGITDPATFELPIRETRTKLEIVQAQLDELTNEIELDKLTNEIDAQVADSLMTKKQKALRRSFMQTKSDIENNIRLLQSSQTQKPLMTLKKVKNSQARLDKVTTAIAKIDEVAKTQVKYKRQRLLQSKSALEANMKLLQSSQCQNGAIETPVPVSHKPLSAQANAFVPQPQPLLSPTKPPRRSPRNLVSTGLTATNQVNNTLPGTSKSTVQHPVASSGPGPRPPVQKARARDQIVPPSAASGGVPEPSPAYMSYANMTPQVANVPQHLLLVIDLNGTLLHRPHSANNPSRFIERPSTQQFLNYACANFSVMIWSSARPANVTRMCNTLFPGESRDRLVAIWGRDRLGLTSSDYEKRVQVYKRLQLIWKDPQVQSKHPQAREGKVWHQGNTVLLDDSVEKSRSEPHNFVEIVEFTGADEDPDILKHVAEYLAVLRMQSNVSSYIRQYPLRNPRNPKLGTANRPIPVD